MSCMRVVRKYYLVIFQTPIREGDQRKSDGCWGLDKRDLGDSGFVEQA